MLAPSLQTFPKYHLNYCILKPGLLLTHGLLLQGRSKLSSVGFKASKPADNDAAEKPASATEKLTPLTDTWRAAEFTPASHAQPNGPAAHGLSTEHAAASTSEANSVPNGVALEEVHGKAGGKDEMAAGHRPALSIDRVAEEGAEEGPAAHPVALSPGAASSDSGLSSGTDVSLPGAQEAEGTPQSKVGNNEKE